MELIYIISGFGVGLLVGLTGVGGGALMTPLLIFGFGVAPAVAVGTDLLFAAVTKSNAVWLHARRGSVDWVIVRRLAYGSLPMSLVTLWVLAGIDISAAPMQAVVRTVLGLVLILTAIALLWRKQIQNSLCDPLQAHGKNSGQERFLLTVAIGGVLGVLVTLTSVGAGALGVVVLFWLYPRLGVARTIGTDIAHAIPLTAIAGLGHWKLGSVDLGLLTLLLAGSLPGIYLGSRLVTSLSENCLRPILAVMLLLIGFRLVG